MSIHNAIDVMVSELPTIQPGQHHLLFAKESITSTKCQMMATDDTGKNAYEMTDNGL